MKRRGFLQALLGVSASPFLPKLPKSTALNTPVAGYGGFGLASIKAKGAKVVSKIISTGHLLKLLWPGVKAWWDKHYKEVPESWEE